MRSRLAARRRGLPRPTLSSWTCFRAPLRSSLWIGSMNPASLKRRNSMSSSLAALIPDLKGGSWRFSVICIKRSPDPGSSLFPPALPTRQEKGCFQDLEISWCRSLKNVSFLLHQPCGFCGAGLHRHSCGRGHSSLPSFALFGAFLEVSSPPSN